MLLLIEYAHEAADRIYRAIVDSDPGVKRLLPILKSYDSTGSTGNVEFDTTRPVWPTDPNKCHISHVVCDTTSWEQKMVQTLEDMNEVVAYVKNHNLGFTIPYTFEGEQHVYIPDFIVRLRSPDSSSETEPLNLIVEVSGKPKPEKAAKTDTARTLWVPAVNNHAGFGRWTFLEVSDPWDAKGPIRAALAEFMSRKGQTMEATV
jgi:type III restriction enzyme